MPIFFSKFLIIHFFYWVSCWFISHDILRCLSDSIYLNLFLKFIFGLTYIDGCRLGYAIAFMSPPQEHWLSLAICSFTRTQKRHMIFEYNVNGTT